MKKTWRYRVRPIRVEGEIAFVPLTRGFEAIIDAVDISLVDGWNWSALPNDAGGWYAYSGARRKVPLHGIVLPVPAGFLVDHRDGDGLNCRRANLRKATAQQNAQNRRKTRVSASIFKGITLDGNNWRARIKVNGRRISLGTFASEKEAARAYDAAALQHFGEFAFPNFRAAD